MYFLSRENELPTLQKMEELASGTILKIAYILLEKQMWKKTVGYPEGLNPVDVQNLREKLYDKFSAKLAAFDWQDSNVRQLINYLRKWIRYGDDWLEEKLAIRPDGTDSTASSFAEWLCVE